MGPRGHPSTLNEKIRPVQETRQILLATRLGIPSYLFNMQSGGPRRFSTGIIRTLSDHGT